MMQSLFKARFIWVCACGLVLLSLSGCGPRNGQTAKPSTTFDEIKRSGRIVAGWAPYAPYASVNLDTKQPEGFYIDLFNRMASEAGLEVTWVESTWSTMVADLEASKFQVFAAPVFETIPRAKEVAFTRPIDYFGLSAVVKPDDDRFKNPMDFNREGVTIAVTQGEVGHEFAIRHLPKATLKVYKSGDISLALVDVIEGRAQVGICDSWTAKQFTANHPGKVKDLFGEHPFNPVGAGWFVRTGSADLLRFLDTSIDWLDTSGAIEQIGKSYQLPSFRKPRVP